MVSPAEASSTAQKNFIEHPPKTSTEELVERVTTEIFGELAALSAFYLISIPFAANPIVLSSIATSLVTTFVVNNFLRILNMTIDDPKSKLSKKMGHIRATLFGRMDNMTRSTVTHELGHSLAASLLYSTPKISISMDQCGGSTWFNPRKLSALGRKVGHRMADEITTIAGTALEIIVSSGMLFYALTLPDSEKKNFLLASSFLSITDHALYAYSALSAPRSNLGHDFVNLAVRHGITPMQSVVGILAIPVIILTGFQVASMYKAAQQPCPE